jgi:hypothetical protein
MIYIVNCSGGLTSFEALRRTLAKHGKEQTYAIFADTRIEDEDLYRFLDDQERYFGIPIHRVKDGRTPWEVMIDERCITLQEMAPCSKHLKRIAIERYISATFTPGTYTRVFGMDWSEMHRVKRLAAALAPQPAWFPLCERPYVDKCHIAASLEQIGIKVPRLYEMGFTHNNCGGGCVKAGQAHWAHLFYTMPERYALWERKEEEIQARIGKPVTILRIRRDHESIPISLKAFRERLQAGDTSYDKDDWGGCGCFAPIAQERMDTLLLAADVKYAAVQQGGEM